MATGIHLTVHIKSSFNIHILKRNSDQEGRYIIVQGRLVNASITDKCICTPRKREQLFEVIAVRTALNELL